MRRSRGFTLLELLVVMIIISLLASMVLFALFRAQQSANQAKTKALIVKIHNILARHWDTYQTRRVPVIVPKGWTPAEAAELRLVGLRQVMRRELPDRWSEVRVGHNVKSPYLKRVDGSRFKKNGKALSPTLKYPPGLAHVYLDYYNSVSFGITPTNVPTDKFQTAECLYMIITRGLSDELDGLDIFSEDEIGDVDGDGATEFLDAWGTPICFLRWPVGFVDDPQQDDPSKSDHPFGHLSDLQPAKMPSGAASPYLACVPNAVDEHDPFDPAYVDKKHRTNPANRQSYAFRVFPLIYSAGPDRIFDIYDGGGLGTVHGWAVVDDPYKDYRKSKNLCATYDPETSTPQYLGMPADLPSTYTLGANRGNGRLEHHDNIHNHLLDTSLR